MDSVWTNLLSGFIGAVVGGTLALAGSVKASRDQAASDRKLDEARELRAHRAAVRAIVVELSSNMVALEQTLKTSLKAAHAAVDTSAYDSLLVSFYALLPDDLAFPVARAYSRLHIFKSKPAILATEEPDEVPNAFKALVRYAVEQLDLDFPVPEITEPGSQPTS